MSTSSKPVSLEVLEDRSAQSSCTEGFLRLRRLRVRHRYADGSCSPPYSCDVVSRRCVDAVAVALWFVGEDGRRKVVLKEGVRPPIWLRRERVLVQPDPEPPLVIAELVAGLLEDEDTGPEGLRRRAVAECWEEAGLRLSPAAFTPLGAPLYPSPGAGDERVYFLAARLDGPPCTVQPPPGDGSPMEHGTRILVLDLEDALTRCRDGRIPDMKTEIALARL